VNIQFVTEKMNKLQCLRRIVASLSSKRSPLGNVKVADIDALNFYKARLIPTGEFLGIHAAGAEAFERIAELIFTGSAAYQRGTTSKELAETIFVCILENFAGRDPDTISNFDIELVDATVATWFDTTAQTQRMFVPCAITGQSSRAFSMGPVSFQFAPAFRPECDVDLQSLARLRIHMRERGATWIATVEVANCQPNRAWELGELAIDLALVGLQLFLPTSDGMSRMNARTVPQFQVRIADQGASWSNHAPGLALAPGALERHLDQAEPLLESVGARITNFLNPGGPLPRLNSAWADAAYWFHEGITEPLDAIAVPKLETAIEVLMRSGNMSGSRTRLITAIHAFYGLKEADLINPDSQISVRQLVKTFLSDRSMILHGTASTLGTSFLSSRSSLKDLVRGLLTNYSILLDEYGTGSNPSDEIDSFLTWVGRKLESEK